MLLIIASFVSTAPLWSPRPGWTQATLDRYQRARAGVWHGKGSLYNTLSGAHLADVELVELVRPAESPAEEDEVAQKAAGPGAADAVTSLTSERLLLYRDSNGTLLTSVGRERVWPLRYSHRVVLSAHEGSLLLRARARGGRQIASAWASETSPVRRPFSTVFTLSVRPLRGRGKDGASPPPAPPTRKWATGAHRRGTDGAPPVAAPVLGPTREEYRVVAPALPLRAATLRYRRVGRCPSWCGAGVCTLEVDMTRQRERRRWFPFGRSRVADCMAQLAEDGAEVESQ